MGGELAEVPNVVSQVVEQNVYIPVRGGPAPVVESISHAPTVFSPVVEHISPASAVLPAPAPVLEFIAPVPAVIHSATPIRHPRPQCYMLLCLLWSLLHPRQSCPNRQRQVGISHPLQPCFKHQLQSWSISHLRQLCHMRHVVEVFEALSPDRVPPLVVDMFFLFRLVGDARRMRMAVCTIGMCTRARRGLRL